MKRALFLLLAIAALATEAHATVLVYAGIVRRLEGPETAIPNSVKIFFLFDPVTGETRTLRYWATGGKKLLEQHPVETPEINDADLARGKTATVISSASHTSAAPDFSNAITFLRGTQMTLKIRSDGTTLNQPRVFNGSVLKASFASNAGTLLDERMLLAISTKRTIDANDASQTIAQTYADLVQELQKRGYQ